jgi:hypothetical protein
LLDRHSSQVLALDRHPQLPGRTEWAQFSPAGGGVLCDTERTREDGSLVQAVYYLPLASLGDVYLLYEAAGDNGNPVLSLPGSWPDP